MGSKGQRGRNRGRGRGRGRGNGHRGAFGGTGRHGDQNISMHPILESTGRLALQDDGEDFFVFGQFDMTSDIDSDDMADGRSKHSRRKAKIKKTQSKRSGFLEENDNITTFQQQQQQETDLNINNNDNKSKGTPKTCRNRGKKATGNYLHVTNTSTHFVRSTTRWNDDAPKPEETDDSHSDDDDIERDVDLNNLHLDIGDLDINDDDLAGLTLQQQQQQQPSTIPPLTGTESSDEDSDTNDDEKWTDHDIMRIVLEHEDDDDAIRDYLDGLTVDQLDRLDTFFEQHGIEQNDGDTDESDDDDDDDDDDLLIYEECYLANHGLGDDDDQDVISPDRFRISLEEALSNVPPGLKPGMRNWISHDKKEAKRKKRLEKKERKKEAKAKKQPNKDKQKRGGPLPEPSELLKIDSHVRDFINDSQLNSYQFAPMSKNIRKQVHLLATAYNLKSASVGTGKIRTPIITKTDRTFIPQDRRYIDRFIAEAQSTITAQNSIVRKKQQIPSNTPSFGGHTKSKKSRKDKERDQKQQRSSSSPKKKSSAATGDLGPSSHGTIVASNAAPITESNVGHRLLTAMGWKEGSGLGSNQEGITVPIDAIIRGKRRGLGT